MVKQTLLSIPQLQKAENPAAWIHAHRNIAITWLYGYYDISFFPVAQLFSIVPHRSYNWIVINDLTNNLAPFLERNWKEAGVNIRQNPPRRHPVGRR